ncbi:basic blue protein-like [Zingiber officinale]|uniref:Phytocyanin domain-containing protein n=1 Tax=Zingiber officinale TaxID=94328 RepID=A0A8J5LES0_ZINOF|nr:basic blue protein-like [Zingiber officinale]KAG6510223.1 hypothetical protein ZIOFF_028232 [Zingiber officinale]
MAQPPQARSALVILALVVVGHCLLGHTEATDFIVGDAGGWKFNVIDWPNGKSFKAGDVLGKTSGDLSERKTIYSFAVFNYAAGSHNVVSVTEAGYDQCLPFDGKVYTSGKDRITLVKGDNYFICSFPGHCAANIKIKVTAT